MSEFLNLKAAVLEGIISTCETTRLRAGPVVDALCDAIVAAIIRPEVIDSIRAELEQAGE